MQPPDPFFQMVAASELFRKPSDWVPVFEKSN